MGRVKLWCEKRKRWFCQPNYFFALGALQKPFLQKQVLQKKNPIKKNGNPPNPPPFRKGPGLFPLMRAVPSLFRGQREPRITFYAKERIPYGTRSTQKCFSKTHERM